MTQGTITRTVRYGIESTRGTAVACTSIMDISDAEWDVVPPVVRSENLTGGVDPSPVFASGVLIPRVRVKLGSVNWDRWQRLLACALDGSITAAGAGADKTWGSNAIKPPAVSTGGALTESLKSMTLEFGFANPSAAQPAHRLPGCVVERLKLTVPRTGLATAEADFVSISPVADITSYTGALSPDAMSAAVPDGTMLRVWNDPTTIGTTQDTAAIAAEVEWTSFMAADDNARKLGIARRHEWTAKVTRFWDDAGGLAQARSTAQRKVRIDLVGPALGAGTWVLGFDLYAEAESRALTELSGFAGEELTLVPLRDATAGASIAARLVNSVSAL